MQDEQKHIMIQWKGDNLKEVIDFTDNINFDKWFTSFEDYEKYVHEHNNIFKLFNEDGSHYEVPVGAWIVKTPDGYNIASKAVLKQKPADKVEPRFKVGDWLVSDCNNVAYIESISETKYNLQCIDGYHEKMSVEYVDRYWHLWTIKDAEDGDVLAEHETIVLFKKIEGQNIRCYCTYHYLSFNPTFYVGTLQNKYSYYPATKEQCDILFQKMKEAGYEWDAEKKELRVIEQSCYHNDGLYYAIDILEKTLGKVEGYQSDDGKMEHQIAIETVNALYHKKPAEWSDEDEANMDAVWRACGHVYGVKYQSILGDWLKTLKDKVQPQPKQTQQKPDWSEEDEENRINAIKYLEIFDAQAIHGDVAIPCINWLKLLKPNHWKPSEKQMEELARITRGNSYPHLSSLYNELKKL